MIDYLLPCLTVARRIIFTLPAYAALLLFCATTAAGWGWKDAVEVWRAYK